MLMCHYQTRWGGEGSVVITTGQNYMPEQYCYASWQPVVSLRNLPTRSDSGGSHKLSKEERNVRIGAQSARMNVSRAMLEWWYRTMRGDCIEGGVDAEVQYDARRGTREKGRPTERTTQRYVGETRVSQKAIGQSIVRQGRDRAARA